MERNGNERVAVQGQPASARQARHSILDLAPLELECMNALWALGFGTVRDVHRRLAASRPRAYTTVLTIMDRLERKRIVSRRKAGRAYLYRAELTAEEARLKAVAKIIDNFFGGSAEALAAHLSAQSEALQSARHASQAVVDSPGAAPSESGKRNLGETLA